MRSRVLLALSCGGLLFCHALSATTLKFGSDVELLAIDGQPLPAALFKSANSLELDAGIHQMLFRVAKPLTANGEPHYSAPLIALFDTRDATSVTIKLPRIGDDRDIRQLEQTLNFELLNHRGIPLEYRADVLSSPPAGDYRQQLQRYNHSAAAAALPALTR
ncbi:DUF2057 family protein [Edwardsiella piscicida]|uniref:DUF2057 domain-containing protein n=3 Tax=Edwardsiella TaxID=635 RepID=A0A0H3DRV4_EDWTF|nr:DUF2057 family protein [Edwardsiella piscicida]ACY84119.1 hypothetical protein ETAE_1276 [Edwardsiella tarda EIB202]ADM41306.1 hypothetical protein ETAF_1190 [Edwardsiella tarda FL6-60]AGH73335.1 hypothetical protein ETAC_06050 [Edwardsiella piscicida C07-087]AOP42650.1 DUF2057 family protein [Edwardsiella piscicida]EKS7765092.1 DUF2057 family protein [Edwardsiella piscicida]